LLHVDGEQDGAVEFKCHAASLSWRRTRHQ
jgi:hypothetical protein